MNKTVAIIQSNYIPWKGYFDLIRRVDEVILYDDAQYTRRDWRNRNRIKTPEGVRWLTVPVEAKGKYHQRICETQVAETTWAKKHWLQLERCYARTPHFNTYAPLVKDLYERCSNLSRLSDINHLWLRTLCRELGITTDFSWSMDYRLESDNATGRLVDLCRQSGATTYLSGPAARAYMKETDFVNAGIALQYMSYQGYSEYAQPHPPFEHAVSILDMLFSVGEDTDRYLRAGETNSAA